VQKCFTPSMAQPCTLVIFGGAGDLSRRKLLPALYNLALDGALPTNFAVVGFSMNDFNDESYRAFAREGVERFSRRPVDQEHWPDYERTLFYVPGRFDDPQAYEALKQKLAEVEPRFGIPGNRVIYLSIPPSQFPTVVRQLKRSGLSDSGGHGWRRVVIEKPFGWGEESAAAA